MPEKGRLNFEFNGGKALAGARVHPDFHSTDWYVFAEEGELPSANYFAITEDREPGPRLFPISLTYYAVYFADPCGNQYELVRRLN
ncbi:hypothetical protein PAECIP111892_01417 [Paenibacillus auburnensis]|uniref:Glyoxalase n=1 Tax=Paenibacillus auburnensis TaxID=2905649 RepID=A0ABM9BUK5_9BACL|nr:hypothetical protein [Paenibacillus auburnensis]CAH1194121.1 hypothetical protein PAECIP111892_01417 [Paenibacillus auburnensis]